MVRPGHRSQTAQALVEFALIAPVLLLIIGATVDMGRGLLLYSLLSGASRDMARQAALPYYSGSNTLPPDCTALATPCSLNPLINSAHLLDALGVQVVYQDSGSISAAPAAYGTYAAGAAGQPGTITLAGGTNANTVYVFIYELDSTAGNPNPRWSCPTCAATNGAAVRTSGHQLAVVGVYVRTSGHQLVVVDLKLKWQPVLAHLLGLPAAITFDSQSVERMEF